ncbi:MAG: carboxypeptidase-like regulatory domain-containing protein [Armatimonadota bacterium]|nr:carboxypeptidase-like regulatory domain-containing protein [Armatimonadota bacterium]MDR5702893.1 carboxypeptidase-like regulatory domain-containing protein [Armatimonadota bacterium]
MRTRYPRKGKRKGAGTGKAWLKGFLLSVAIVILAQLAYAQPGTPVVATPLVQVEGQVVNTQGQPISRATITYADRLGGDRKTTASDNRGRFRFMVSGDQLRVDFSAPGYRPRSQVVPIGEGTTQLQIFAVLPPSSDVMVFIFLLPALAGIVIWVFFRIWGAAPWVTHLYSITSVLSWVGVFVAFLYTWLRSGVSTLQFFHPDVEISLLVPIFAFIGVLLYATTSIVEHFGDPHGRMAYRKSLMAVAHRVLLAPYVAVIANLLLVKAALEEVLSVQPGVGLTTVEVFLAFFTGAYMKPILNWINERGARLLPRPLQEELEMREQPNELVKKLGMTVELAEDLGRKGISTVQDLEELSDEDLSRIAEEIVLDRDQLLHWRSMAKAYRQNFATMQRLLNLKSHEEELLEEARIISIWQLGRMEPEELTGRIPEFDRTKAEYLCKASKGYAALLGVSPSLLDKLNHRKIKEIVNLSNIPTNLEEEFERLIKILKEPGVLEAVGETEISAVVTARGASG